MEIKSKREKEIQGIEIETKSHGKFSDIKALSFMTFENGNKSINKTDQERKKKKSD